MKRNYLTMNEKYLLTIVVVLFVVAFLSACAGPRGDAGARGNPGFSPLVGTLPATSYECPNGGLEVWVQTTKTIVCNGVNGAVGPTGGQGIPGVDATPVSIFQFCPGTSSYSNFLEFGIKIGTSIYAVYSANNGFLTLLAPGGYVTTATGANCNFIVHSDGTVSY